MTVFIIRLSFSMFLLLLTPIQGHSLWSPKHCAAGGNTHIRLAVYYRVHRDKHTIHSHCTKQFPVYISLEYEKKPELNPDRYSSCKLQGSKFKPTLCARQQGNPMKHCITLINKLYTNKATPSFFLYLVQRTLSRVKILGAVNSLWLCPGLNHPL